MMDIVTSLTAISQAVGIAKEIRDIDRSVDEAGFKLKVAELVSALADAKISLADAQQEMSGLRNRISELEEGPLCPICKNGRVTVLRVERSQHASMWEKHVCACNSPECSYENRRSFNQDTLSYDRS